MRLFALVRTKVFDYQTDRLFVADASDSMHAMNKLFAGFFYFFYPTPLAAGRE